MAKKTKNEDEITTQVYSGIKFIKLTQTASMTKLYKMKIDEEDSSRTASAAHHRRNESESLATKPTCDPVRSLTYLLADWLE